MPIGPGVYDDLCTHVREQTGATGVVVIVAGGCKGSGFSVQGDIFFHAALADILINVAQEIKNTALSQ